VVFIRHAETDPGVGDPPGFRLEDCKTQRNLSAAGREQAQRLGEAFRRERVPVAQVLSSEWCRCRDTATLAFGRHEAWPALNNLFGRRENEPAQTRAMLERASAYRGTGNLILVTHGSTIVPVAGINPAQGELVVMRPVAAGKLELVGRLRPG
jgi:broad specificity phosphatase PhoE